MKSILFVLATAAAFCHAEDDGQYHPERYGSDDGQYRPQGRYYQPPTYYNTFSTPSPLLNYQPVYYKTAQPYYQQPQQYYQQPLLAPLVSYGGNSGIVQNPFASPSSVDTVTIRPAVYSSTAAPVVYSSTPKPLSLIAQQVPYVTRQYTGAPSAGILRQTNDAIATGYRYNYQTDNGIAAEEVGNVAAGSGTQAAGFYEYVGDNGLKYRVNYTADENGFRPRGAHIPV